VLLTRGRRPGLFLSNALAFRNPSGPPMLQVSNAESEWLKEQLQVQAEATLVVQAIRTAAQAFNVTAKISGSNPKITSAIEKEGLTVDESGVQRFRENDSLNRTT
jgi:precorrin isomerase